MKDSITFKCRRRSSSDADALSAGEHDETGQTGFTGTGSHWPSLSTSVPTPTSPAAKMLSNGGGMYNMMF